LSIKTAKISVPILASQTASLGVGAQRIGDSITDFIRVMDMKKRTRQKLLRIF
jgi:hypothetical protein